MILYELLYKLVNDSPKPLTCTDLWALPIVKANAEDADRVSNVLGNLYRRRHLSRIPAPRVLGNLSKWAYVPIRKKP